MAALLCISEHLGSGLEQESMFCCKFPETEQQKCWLQGKTFFLYQIHLKVWTSALKSLSNKYFKIWSLHWRHQPCLFPKSLWHLHVFSNAHMSGISCIIQLAAKKCIVLYMYSGLAKSIAQRPGAIVFSSRATKMYHCPARRATLNTGLPRVLKISSI